MNSDFNIEDPWKDDNLQGLKIYNVSEHQGTCDVASLLVQNGADIAISREEADVIISLKDCVVLGRDRGGSLIFSARTGLVGGLLPDDGKKIVTTLAHLKKTKAHRLLD
ncbi:MAG: hypothetical protein NUV85_01420 [Candidatus Berkelbacteria bacterium]|nr:hypothetical protein [Candidatus Berkelbacteria bacterium]